MWMPLHSIQEIHETNEEQLIQYMVTCLNMFPSKNGILKTKPAAIISGFPNQDYNRLRIAFRLYAQVYISTTKNTKQRKVGAIVLQSANKRGGYYFMSINTGGQIHPYIWT